MSTETSHPDRVHVLIVGAGLSGICVALRLLKAGITDFRILEKASGAGGVWRYNTYPGSACDVKAYTYSFSFALNRNWTQMYATQREILAYAEGLCRDHDLYSKMIFDTEVRSYDYDDTEAAWTVTAADAAYTADILVDATGVLHRPKVPDIAGRSRFTGAAFHSAEWDHSVDLRGKRVAVVGTGASAVQILPEISKYAARVDVFQRTPQWVLPRANRPLLSVERALYRWFPATQKIQRYLNYWMHELVVVAFLHPALMTVFGAVSKRFLARQVSDPQLRAALTPDYRPGCKRFLITSEFYPALQRPNVRLVTDHITEFVESGLRTADGAVHELDAVVYCTGFRTDERIALDHVAGREGTLLSEVWRDGMEAHLGTSVSGFPNFFLMMGPNSGSGHQSILFAIEVQASYIVKCIQHMRRRRWRRIEVEAGAQKTFNEFVGSRLSGSVWNSGGCTSWFLDKAGKNRQVWPGWSVAYWWRLRRPVDKHFVAASQQSPTAELLGSER
ncbi:NAD(P)/FAD-dependent oxidoreductase [Nocardia sp. BMG51109]|uniref:flavin-containing monooxygenase n=1 Tax=Nocardia sp. BMG51109 TaxID=1056816 RepID=UPI0004647E9E|nr:NAD(P)/FAD-dependent oxidoreductase [Nocardia sp. BMG51109]